MIAEGNCDSAQQVPAATEEPTQAPEVEQATGIEIEENEESLRAELEEKTLLLNRNENRIREQQEEIQQLRESSSSTNTEEEGRDGGESEETDLHMEIIHLREKRDLFFEEREALRKDNQNLRNEITTYLTNEVSQYATDRKRLNDTRKSLTTELTKATTACRVLDHKYAQARARAHDLEERVTTLAAANRDLLEANEALTASCERAHREGAARAELLAQNYRALEGQLHAERDAGAALRKHVVEADAAAAELRAEAAQQRLALAHERANFEALAARYKALSDAHERHLSDAHERAAADALALRALESELENARKSRLDQQPLPLPATAPNAPGKVAGAAAAGTGFGEAEACRRLMSEVELERVKAKLIELARSEPENGNSGGEGALRASELCAALQRLNGRYNSLAKALESETVRGNMLARELAECREAAARAAAEHTELERLREAHAELEKTCAAEREARERLEAENADLTRRATAAEFQCAALSKELAQTLIAKSYNNNNNNNKVSEINNNWDVLGAVPERFTRFESVVDLETKYNEVLSQLRALEADSGVAERRRAAAEAEQLRGELGAARARVRALGEAAAAGEREREALLALLKRGETARESGAAFLDAAQRFGAAFRRHREESRRAAERLEGELQGLSERLLGAQKEGAALAVALAAETARAKALAAENSRVAQANRNYVQQVGRAEAALGASARDLAEARRALAATQHSLRAAEREAAEQGRRAQRLEGELQRAAAAQEALEGERAALAAEAAELAALRDARDDAQDELNELQGRHLRDAAAQVAALRDALARKTAEASAMEAALRIQVEEGRQRLVAAEARCAETRAELATARGDEAALRVELRAERDRRELLNKKIADVNAEHRVTLYDREHGLAEKVRACEARNAELTEQLRAERERTAALGKASERAAEDRRAAAATIDGINTEAERRVAECRAQVDALRSMLEETERARADADCRRQRAEDELVERKTAEYTRDKMKKQIQDMAEEKARLSQELNALRKSVAAAKTTTTTTPKTQGEINTAAATVLPQKQQQQQSQPQQSQQPQQYQKQVEELTLEKNELSEKNKHLATEIERLGQEKAAREQELGQEKSAHEKYFGLYKDANEYAKRLEELLSNSMTGHAQASPLGSQSPQPQAGPAGRGDDEDEKEIRNREEIAKLREAARKHKDEADALRAKVSELEALYKGVPTAVAYEEEKKRLFMLDVTLDSNNVIRAEKKKADESLKKVREELEALQLRLDALRMDNEKKNERIASLEKEVLDSTDLREADDLRAKLEDVIRRRNEVFDKVRTKLSAQDLIYVGISAVHPQGRSAVMNNSAQQPHQQQQGSQPQLQAKPQLQQQQQNAGMKRGRDDQHQFYHQQKVNQMQPKQKQNKLNK